MKQSIHRKGISHDANERPQQKGKRQIKVYEKSISRAYYTTVIVPEIRLCGKWLRETGFDCGQSVTVQLKKNKITITVDTDTQCN